MDLQLTGKRAIVLGGTKGIGRAAAEALAREGATVTVAARHDVETIAATIAAETGGTVHGVAIDSRDDASVQSGIAAAVAAMGGVDILVNTAAAPWSAAKNTVATETSDDAMRQEFEEKVLGYLRAARAVSPHLVAGGWGRIINVSGLGARKTGSVAQTVRNISVAAITKNLADELGPLGTNVSVVHPGLTRTEGVAARIDAAVAAGTPLAEAERVLAGNLIGRVVTPAELADVIVFLASPRSVAITGGAVDAGGGTPGVVTY
ncbi:SDR family NAD(P)-dependent oxidoreductase [Pseudolysinimonas sp.]|jgi:NAD(P)-dependent dehydrogenase (short-subunit alcohol dehydrogenase family)|uniref:SDR family NAD(P)-dependent oxidoreductase n=1 Tax=Pseudolysinimonas sp. TaxID=2680009 RepID=UPI003783639C